MVNPWHTVLTLQASRYLGGAGITALFYDHVLLFQEEVELVWKAKWSPPKVLFLLLRYVVGAGILLSTYHLSGLAGRDFSAGFCKRWYDAAAVLCVFTTGSLHFLLILWLWVIWKRNQRLVNITFGLFILTQMSVIALAVNGIFKVGPTLRFDTDPQMGICAIGDPRRRTLFSVIFVPGVFFEAIVSIIVGYNAIRGPSLHDMKISARVYKLGVSSTLIIFTVTVLNLVASMAAPSQDLFIYVCFCWCITTVTETRLILNLRRCALTRSIITTADLDDREICSLQRLPSS